MKSTIERLKSHASPIPSRWREEATLRIENKEWLRQSQKIAMKMLDRMEEISITQKSLAERMGCTQQYVSKILKGKENLSLETMCKIEGALNIRLVCEPELV